MDWVATAMPVVYAVETVRTGGRGWMDGGCSLDKDAAREELYLDHGAWDEAGGLAEVVVPWCAA